MHLRGIPSGTVILAGSFSADSQGRWYVNCPIRIPANWFKRASNASLGVDLGLNDLAGLSDGNTVENPRHFRRLESHLGIAQRARKKRRVRAIHNQIANARRDYLHKASAAIAKAHDIIVVGKVSSSKLSRTSMAKSVQDAGWGIFKTQLAYKAIRHGGRYVEVSEKWTTQLCSRCGSLGGPKGIAQLGIREWTCGDCGARHQRDTNAARNILARGLASLAEGALRV